MQMMIDSEGMAIRVNLDTENNMVSKSLYSATKRKDVSGMSFAFLVDGEEWTDLDSDMPTRNIRSIKKVFEVSACTFPAYNQTVLEARTADHWRMISQLWREQKRQRGTLIFETKSKH